MSEAQGHANVSKHKLPPGARDEHRKKIYEADEDGIVHVAFPTGRPGVKIEVLVVWDEPSTDPAAPDEDWSDLFGMLKDAPLERPPQGEFEQRDEFK